MIFIEKLIKLRKEKGWSQEELGNRLNVTRQTISKWELGQTTPEMNKLLELSNIFEISLDELLDNAQYSFKKETIYVPVKYHYEYKSQKEFFGVPLVHINIGRGLYKAKGIIAIGNIATGILSLGILSLGIISVGILALGLLTLGCIVLGLIACGAISFGVLSLGGIAIGVLSLGGLAIGMYSIGGCAIASNIALGGYANGHIAIGDTVKGTIEFITYNNLDDIDFSEVKRAILKEFPNIWDPILKLFTSF